MMLLCPPWLFARGVTIAAVSIYSYLAGVQQSGPQVLANAQLLDYENWHSSKLRSQAHIGVSSCLMRDRDRCLWSFA